LPPRNSFRRDHHDRRPSKVWKLIELTRSDSFMPAGRGGSRELALHQKAEDHRALTALRAMRDAELSWASVNQAFPKAGIIDRWETRKDTFAESDLVRRSADQGR
jgi:hypothetical protein